MLHNSVVNKTTSQKDLGMYITCDLKWNKQVQEVLCKANTEDVGFRQTIIIRYPQSAGS